jgi:hypothetical protein
MVYFDILFWHSSGRTEEQPKIPQNSLFSIQHLNKRPPEYKLQMVMRSYTGWKNTIPHSSNSGCFQHRVGRNLSCNNTSQQTPIMAAHGGMRQLNTSLCYVKHMVYFQNPLTVLRGKVKNYPHFCFSNLFASKWNTL